MVKKTTSNLNNLWLLRNENFSKKRHVKIVNSLFTIVPKRGLLLKCHAHIRSNLRSVLRSNSTVLLWQKGRCMVFQYMIERKIYTTIGQLILYLLGTYRSRTWYMQHLLNFNHVIQQKISITTYLYYCSTFLIRNNFLIYLILKVLACADARVDD